ncbi:MAG: type II secretion system protein GspC [Halioglobus sp.]
MLPAQWLSNAGDWPARVSASLQPMLHTLSQPAQARQLRRLVLLLLAVWGAVALARLVWALLPADAQGIAAPPAVINPVSSRGPAAAVTGDLDIARMRGWHLFGEAGSAPSVPVPEPVVANPREGIERDAKETRLALKLRGVLASTSEGLGHAIIEHRAKQEIYAVEDKLPVPGRVHLAKVMPQQVILDNGGTYERLELFDASDLDMPANRAPPSAANVPVRRIDKRAEPQTTALATSYRTRLFENPQSLAEVVNVSAVRRDGALVGYRVVPGNDREQFEQLGFQPGDLVTGVNGIALDSPANTMRLYNAMRSAGEVVFDLQRNEQALTLAVSLEGDGNP